MKVLIITYYWPPSGGPGVQRWLKFVKYLQGFGIEPIVYTVQNPSYPVTDTSLVNEIPENIKIISQPIWEPNNILSVFKKKGTNQSAGFLNPNPSFFGRVAQYIRANYFIPDARKYWIKPSVNYLEKYISSNAVDMVITSGPPHSMHLIGLELKKSLGVKWISDFRDPWTAIDYFDQLPLTEAARKKHHQLEQDVLRNSDAVIVVGNTMKENYMQFSNNIHVISNGFDTVNSEKNIVKLTSKFSITHIGTMNADRNPLVFWKVIAEISKENKAFSEDLEIKLIGAIAPEVDESIKKFEIHQVVKIDYLKHEVVQGYQHKSQVLLLAVNNVPSAKGIITGKIFEYLKAKRPILAIGPTDGDLAVILKDTNSGVIIDFDDEKNMKASILKLYADYKNNDLTISSQNIEKYHRKSLTSILAKLIKQTI